MGFESPGIPPIEKNSGEYLTPDSKAFLKRIDAEMEFEFDPNKVKSQESQGEVAEDQSILEEKFKNAIKERGNLLLMISGYNRLDSIQEMNLKKHEKVIKDFIEQEKTKFFASLPEKVLGSGQREYTRAELRITAEKIFSGEETQVETMTNGGDLRLRGKVIEILGLMKESDLDEYNLAKKNEPSKSAKAWEPYDFSAKKDKSNY